MCSGPQREIGDAQGPYPKTPETQEFLQKLGSEGFWGETASPKHLQDPIQSIWVAGFPIFWIWGSIPKQNHVFRGPTFGQNIAQAESGALPGIPGQKLDPGSRKWSPGPKI